MKQLITLAAALWCCTLPAQTISTIAGGGPHNLQRLQVGLPLGLPGSPGVAIDAAGNVYVSVINRNQVWKIDPSGSVNVYAGNGVTSTNGDGGPAVNAALYQPMGLACDTSGNLYVATDNKVRKVSTTGIITTFAGSNAYGATGDGGPATAATLANPVALAFDSAGTLYIADHGVDRIRSVSALGIITTFAGNGILGFAGDGGPAISASLNRPNGVAVDSAGTVYIADSQNFRLRKVSGGIISTAAGTGVSGYSGDGGPATGATLNSIAGVTVDQYNNVFIVEENDIREIPSGSSNISTFAGTGIAGFSGDGGSPSTAQLQGASAMAFDKNSFKYYITDVGNRRIRLVSASGISTFAGNGTDDLNSEGLVATNANLYYPTGPVSDNAGTLYIADSGGSVIRKINLSSGILTTVSGPGAFPLSKAAFAYSNGAIYYSRYNQIRKLVGNNDTLVSAEFVQPLGMAVASNGDIYVADGYDSRVRLFTAATGIVTTIAGNGVNDSTGDGGLATNASLRIPTDVALDGAGSLFIACGGDIRKVNLKTGIITTVASPGTYAFTGLFADESSNLFASTGGQIVKIAAGTNALTVVAGNNINNFSGDGGPATAATLQVYAGLSVDRSQNLYFSDYSGRIRTFPVTACFFTFSSPTYTATSAGGTGSITVTATNSTCPYAISSSLPFVTISSGASGTGSGTISFSVAANTGSARMSTVNVGGASFTVSQPAPSTQYNVGFFQPNGPTWALDSDGSGGYNSGDKVFPFAGQPGAIAVVGDWNGDGRSKVGFYLNGFWILDYNGNGVYDGTGPGGDKFYAFGGTGYTPVVGDWNGDGRTKIGYYTAGFWVLDKNGNGQYDGTSTDMFIALGGNTGEVPIVGDWNGDGRTKVGVYFSGKWALDYDGNGSFTATDKYYTGFSYLSGDKPVVGDWNGDGKTKIGVYRGGFWVLDYNGNGSYDGVGSGGDKFYGFGGNTGEVPLVADWNGDGKSKVGVYINGFWIIDYNGNGSYDGTGVGGDRFIAFYGGTGSQPIVGRW